MAASGNIYIVPGFGGSELWAQVQSGARVKLWLDIPSIVQGQAADFLVWGQTPAGVQIVPGQLLDVLGYGYGSLVTACQQFIPQGYQTVPWPYDFRDTCISLGTSLQRSILAAAAPDCKIICHSYGTLIVQVAMALLRQIQADYLVSTVIALAPIFNGSYSTVKAWREEEDSLNHLALGGSVVTYFSQGLGQGQTNQVNYKRRLLTAFTSWPATYDMLPNPYKTDDPGDVQRDKAWASQYWNTALVPPNPSLIANAHNNTWNVITGQAYTLDPAKWLVVSAVDRDNTTPWRLIYPPPPATSPATNPVTLGLGLVADPDWARTLARRQFLPGIAYTSQGDNRSTLGSQTWPGVQSLQLSGAHADLQSHPVVLQLLPQLLGLAPGPQPPPPTLPSAPLPFLSTLAGTPISAIVNWPEHATP